MTLLIDFMAFASTTSRQEMTGLTHLYLLYGREAGLPVDAALGNNPSFTAKKNRHLATRLASIREQVKRRLIAVQAEQNIRYEQHRRAVSFAAGELVWVFTLSTGEKVGSVRKTVMPLLWTVQNCTKT